ncbi:MAG: DUF3833 domain-containing protein [Oceanospirillaceae bacterium]|nr:DUF3833 domain-containing protein [Oceanospirillaceae bacterium]
MTLTLAGCSDMRIEQFQNSAPEFRLERYFDGRVLAWGWFEDRFGNVRRQFFVDIDGQWDGQQLILDESFEYSDGETEHRTWTITPDGQGGYRGRAADIVGTAQGQSAGNALNWRYSMDLKVGDRHWRVQFDDWMLLQPDGVLLNRATVSKWGLTLGEVRLFFVKPEDAKQRLRL